MHERYADLRRRTSDASDTAEGSSSQNDLRRRRDHGRRVHVTTSCRLPACPWQKTQLSGPMSVAGDTSSLRRRGRPRRAQCSAVRLHFSVASCIMHA
jgi:hypothetical protein